MTTQPRANYTASISYDLSPTQSLMLSSSGRMSKITHEHITSNTLTENGTALLTNGTTTTGLDTKNMNVALDYGGTFGHFRLSTTALYSMQHRETDNKMSQTKDDAFTLWTLNQDTKYRVGIVKATGTWTIDNRQNTSLSLYHTSWNNTTDDGYQMEQTLDHRFRFKEQTYQAVGAYEQNGERLSFDLGLRLTHDVQRPTVSHADNVESFSRHYTYLLPSATLTTTLSQEKGISMTLRYGREMATPPMEYYNPGTKFTSDYSYEKGNPKADPEITDELRMQLQLGEWAVYGIGNFSTLPTYTYGVDEAGREFRTLGNDSHSTILTAGVATPMLQPCEGWQITADGYYTWRRFSYLDTRTKGSQVGMNLTSTNSLPWNLLLTLRCNLETRYIMLYSRSTDPGTISLTLSRSWLRGALTASMGGSYSFLQKELMEVEAYRKDMRYTKPQTQFTLNVRYRIDWGNKRARVKRKMGTDSELLRMGAS